MTRIAIIGAGLSGRLLALNLFRRASSSDCIYMVDRNETSAMGPAYSSDEDYLLLNVPACKMGAYSQDPEHFLKWARSKGLPAGPWDFLPRKLFRDYIFAQLQEAQQDSKDCPSLEYLTCEVSDIEISEQGAKLQLTGRDPFMVDKVVLALGNFPPRHPQIRNRAALSSGRYIQVPWTPGIFDSLEAGETVVFIGTGQTTIDLVIALHRRGHKGRMLALSRRGLLPLVHRGFDPYPSFYEEMRDAKRLLDVFRTIRKHLELAEAQGIDPRAVIDSLRPDTQIIWQSLADEEKRRFLRHLFRYWEIIRSRIPPESEALIEEMQKSGQLEIIAGRLADLVENEAGMEVRWFSTAGKGEQVVQAALVINCIGPESDYERVEQPLVKNLLRRGLISPGPANLGINSKPNGTLIGRDGQVSESLFTLGSTMRGVLWEVLAIPEIRLQAEQLAVSLLE
jgi:uncharacterized NAD(P)/FAD-binding protein YdhS